MVCWALLHETYGSTACLQRGGVLTCRMLLWALQEQLSWCVCSWDRAQGLKGSGAYDTYAGMFLHRHGSKGEGLYLAQHSIADPPGVLIVLLQACQRPPTTSMMPTCC